MSSNNGLLIVISAPSGAGKTTLCQQFLKHNPQLHYSISTTTRKPREGEKDGIDYFFITQQEFLSRIEKDAFLEYARVYNEYYGTSKDTVISLLNQGSDVLINVDTQGAASIRRIMPECVQIFILPPSLKVLEQRLRDRRKDSEEVIKVRLSLAQKEIRQSEFYDYIVINDILSDALKNIQAIYRAEKLRVKRNLNTIKGFLE